MSPKSLPLGSVGWLDRRVELAADLPAIEQRTADGPRLIDVDVEVRILDHPDGDVRWVDHFRNGVLSGSTPDGKGEGGDDMVALTLPWPDLKAVVSGELDLNAAFMAGKLKTGGPTGPLLALLAFAATEPALGACSALRADTDLG